ncbi:MAG: hypothetical protein RMI04_09430, partial [Thermofilaceae archaeon]|nr:hypothetical protein [Thermofilaceae archaeon]
MVYTTIAFRRSVLTGNVLTELTTVADPHVAYTASRFFVPDGMNYLAGAYAASSSITNARVDSPSLRRIAP